MPELRPVAGLYFEEFSVGDSITSQGRTVTEADIVNFAMLSGDWNPLHTDAEIAKSTVFGERIAHGMLVLSMATGLADRMGFINGTAILIDGGLSAFYETDWQH